MIKDFWSQRSDFNGEVAEMGRHTVTQRTSTIWNFICLHTAHLGIVEMKSLARQHVWRLGVDKAIVWKCAIKTTTTLYTPLGLAKMSLAKTSYACGPIILVDAQKLIPASSCLDSLQSVQNFTMDVLECEAPRGKTELILNA